MKIICTILALLVLTLSVQPAFMPISANDPCCASTDVCCEGDNDCDDEQDCTNGCNPFQVCGCCAFSAVMPRPIILMQSSPIATVVQWGVSSFSITEEPVSGFWQPPRVIA